MKRSNFTLAATICSLTMLAVSTVFMSQSIFLELSTYFNINLAQARISFSIVSLAYSVTFLLAGPIMDQGNLPRIAFWSALFLAGTLMMTSIVTSYQIFIICMLPIGCCAALIPASMFPYMSTIAPGDKKGLYVGSIVASATLGVIVGRVLSGVFTSLIGWNGAYKIISMIVLLCALMATISFPSSTGSSVKKDFSLLSTYKNSIQLLFKLRVITLMMIGGTLFFGFLGIVTFLSYRLNDSPFNFNAGEIGWISFAGITAIVASFSGQLSRRVNTEIIILYGLLAGIISCLILGLALTVPAIIIGLLLLFLSVYTCQPLIFMMVGNSVPIENMGSASSLYIFFCIGGGSLASIILGPIWTIMGWPGIVVVCSSAMMISLTLMLLLRCREKLSFSSVSDD